MTDKSFLNDLIAKLADIGDATVRPMMGEYLLYLNGKYVSCICDNTVFVKKNGKNAELIENCEQRPPYEGAKPSYVIDTENVDFLRRVIYATYLGAPDKKKK